MELNPSNYHSQEANKHYMSNSQYKDFLECEAAAMAKITGDYTEPPSDALLLGNYVHAWMDNDLEKFKEENPALFTNKGSLYAKFSIGDDMINTLKNSELCMYALEGDKEVIITAEFAGAPWKIKIDAYNPDKGRFADLKTLRSIRDKHWLPEEGWVSIVQAYGYVRQFALYAEIERIATGREMPLDPFIVAVSKEDPPDKEVISIDQNSMVYELELITENMPRILKVKNGIVEPKRCEKCKHCRLTKVLKTTTHYMDLLQVSGGN
jgi:hypothetical protein